MKPSIKQAVQKPCRENSGALVTWTVQNRMEQMPTTVFTSTRLVGPTPSPIFLHTRRQINCGNPAITVSAETNSVSGSLYVPPSTESYTYDDDGNLTSDGRWSYLWDGENRLIEMRPQSNAPSAAKMWLKFEYDYLGRRIQKTAAQWTNSARSLVVSNRFLYDGWNLIAELNATNNTLIRGYLWGIDLSGSLQGAGGVDGLIAVKEGSGNAHFAACDGNGNVIALVNATTGTYSAQYEYDPFGQTIRATGPMAKLNPYRFSTKYQDEESGLYYYGYRYYNPSTGRWPNRDPLGEPGFEALRTPNKVSSKTSVTFRKNVRKEYHALSSGSNLYAFIDNESLNSYDLLGTTPGIAIGLIIEKINHLLRTAGGLALCRCAGCIAAIDEQLGACAIYSSGDD
jgi:RHS repeat-associated protein